MTIKKSVLYSPLWKGRDELPGSIEGDLTTFEQLRDKASSIKRGMVQELLTGGVNHV